MGIMFCFLFNVGAAALNLYVVFEKKHLKEDYTFNIVCVYISSAMAIWMLSLY